MSYNARAAGDSCARLRVTSTSVRDTAGSTKPIVRIIGYAFFWIASFGTTAAPAFRDEAERRRAALHFVERMQRHAARLQRAVEQPAIAAHFTGEDQRMRLQRGPANAPPLRERMIVAAHQHIGVARQRHVDQLGMLVAGDADAELGFAMQHGLQHRRDA